MNTKFTTPVLFAFLLASAGAFAAEGKVTITSPANGATVSSHDNIELSYMASPGSEGDHLHLYLDGKRVDIIRTMKGKAGVGMLASGKHHICMEVNTKGHVPTGSEACIDVTSK